MANFELEIPELRFVILGSEDEGSPQGTDLFPAAVGLASPTRSEKKSD